MTARYPQAVIGRLSERVCPTSVGSALRTFGRSCNIISQPWPKARLSQQCTDDLKHCHVRSMATASGVTKLDNGENSISQILAPYKKSFKEDSNRLSEADVRQIAHDLERDGKTSWSRVPRIYTVLRLIGQLQLLDAFIQQDISDIWFPFSLHTLPDCLNSPPDRNNFLDLQWMVLTKAFDLEREDGKHRHFASSDDIPMRRLAMLGRGGFGVVDHVVSGITHKEYARKLLFRGKTFKKHTQVLQDFERELGHLKKLRHFHIVELVGSYTDPKYVGILMSPVADCDLRTFLGLDPLPLNHRSLLRTFFGCLATAVSYLHKNHVRHKDIKPRNILVKGDRVFLADFGISTDWSALDQSTTSGPMPRTPKYCAPEIAVAKPRNTSSDMWSIGCVFLEIWTVLKGETITSLNEYLKKHGSNSTCYYDNLEATITWCKNLQEKVHWSEEDVPLPWILGMLKFDQHERLSAQELCDHVQEINESGDHLVFSGLCCNRDDDDPGSDSTSEQSSQQEEETSASSVEVYLPSKKKAVDASFRIDEKRISRNIGTLRSPIPSMSDTEQVLAEQEEEARSEVVQRTVLPVDRTSRKISNSNSVLLRQGSQSRKDPLESYWEDAAPPTPPIRPVPPIPPKFISNSTVAPNDSKAADQVILPRTKSGRTPKHPMHLAAHSGNIEMVELLSKYGLDIGAEDDNGLLPIHFAAENGQIAMVNYLRDYGQDIGVRNKNGLGLMHLAVRNRQIVMINHLVQLGQDINARDDDGWNLIHHAAEVGSVPIVQHLQSLGLNVDTKTNQGSLPIHIATKGGHLAMVQYLVQFGQDAGSQTNSGALPIHIAAEFGHKAIAEYLVQLGQSIEIRTKQGLLPIHKAAEFGHRSMLRFFVGLNQSIESKTSTGLLPIHLAARNGHISTVDYLAGLGQDMEAQDYDGITPMLLAIRYGKTDMVNHLVKLGCSFIPVRPYSNSNGI